MEVKVDSIQEGRKVKNQWLKKKDFEKAYEALEEAHVPGPYKAIIAPEGK